MNGKLFYDKIKRTGKKCRSVYARANMRSSANIAPSATSFGTVMRLTTSLQAMIQAPKANVVNQCDSSLNMDTYTGLTTQFLYLDVAE